jgi:hypothetical protein
VTFTNEVDTTEVDCAYAWGTANGRMCVQTSSDPNCLSATSTTDLASVAAAGSYNGYAGVVYDPLGGYDAVAYLANLQSINWNLPAAMRPMMFQQLTGITPSNIGTTAAGVLKTKNCNYYSYFGALNSSSSYAMVAPGIMSSGMWTDKRIGIDWLTAWLQNGVFVYLATNYVPQTNAGVAQILHCIATLMAQAVTNGLIAKGGIWNGNAIGTVVSGQTLADGWYAYGQPIATQSQAQFDARNAPPITIIAIGAGAIQGVQLQLNWQ